MLTPEEVTLLDQLRRSRTAAQREVQRAQVLWLYYTAETIATIMQAMGMTRKGVAKWITKALTMGVAAGLQDTPQGRPPTLTEAAQAGVVHLACAKPKDCGYAAEVWSRQALAQPVRKHAQAEGHASLAQASKATVQRILAAQPLQPHKVTDYLQRRDPELASQMRNLLVVDQEVALQNAQPAATDSSDKVITVSVEAKPGVQAIATTAPDWPPGPGTPPALARDHEYKRLGTCSILAALDLHPGHMTARVERRHRSREFIALLQDLDAHCPSDYSIRVVLDKHSAHLSTETRSFLATRPNRFT